MRNRFAATLLALSLLWLNAAFADSGISLSYGKQTYSVKPPRPATSSCATCSRN